MPYKSKSQMRWAHTEAGKKALGGESAVHEWDEATKGKKIPDKVQKTEEIKELKESNQEKAKKADLIKLPEDVKGTNCGNCKFFDKEKSLCKHKKVDQPVTNRMCCIFWDNDGVKRTWGNQEINKAEAGIADAIKPPKPPKPTTSVKSPMKMGSTAVKMPKMKSLPDATDKPSVFFKSEDTILKHPNLIKLKDLIMRHKK